VRFRLQVTSCLIGSWPRGRKLRGTSLLAGNTKSCTSLRPFADAGCA